MLFKSHPRRAPGPQTPAAPGIRPLPAQPSPGPPWPAPPTAAPPADRGTPGPPGCLAARSARGAAPPPPPVRAAAPRSAPSPSSPPLPLPFLSPVQPRSCRRRRRLPRSAGALPAALPAAWHHRGGISREQHLGEAGSQGVGGCPAASVMDVSKMVSEERGLCPGVSPGLRPPPTPSLSPSQSA